MLDKRLVGEGVIRSWMRGLQRKSFINGTKKGLSLGCGLCALKEREQPTTERRRQKEALRPEKKKMSTVSRRKILLPSKRAFFEKSRDKPKKRESVLSSHFQTQESSGPTLKSSRTASEGVPLGTRGREHKTH